MTCPECGGKTRVVDLVKTPDNEVYRRNKCTNCEHEIFSVEFEIEDDKTLRDIWNRYHRSVINKKKRLKKEN